MRGEPSCRRPQSLAQIEGAVEDAAFVFANAASGCHNEVTPTGGDEDEYVVVFNLPVARCPCCLYVRRAAGFEYETVHVSWCRHVLDADEHEVDRLLDTGAFGLRTRSEPWLTRYSQSWNLRSEKLAIT